MFGVDIGSWKSIVARNIN